MMQQITLEQANKILTDDLPFRLDQLFPVFF